MRTVLERFAVLLAVGLAGCVATSNPDTYELEPATVSQLRAPQRIAIKNFYTAETLAGIGGGMKIDLRQISESAITMMRRALEKQGIAVVPEAEKTVVLRVHQVSARPQNFMSPMTRAGVGMDAVYADGTRSMVVADNVGFGAQATDGALLFALRKLASDSAFVAYVNCDAPQRCPAKPGALQFSSGLR